MAWVDEGRELGFGSTVFCGIETVMSAARDAGSRANTDSDRCMTGEQCGIDCAELSAARSVFVVELRNTGESAAELRPPSGSDLDLPKQESSSSQIAFTHPSSMTRTAEGPG